ASWTRAAASRSSPAAAAPPAARCQACPRRRSRLCRFAREAIRGHIGLMTKDQIKAVLDRVLSWPPERQRDAAEILASLEAQDSSPLRLSAEQTAEVRRRQANPSSATIPIDEVFERFRSTDA